MSFVCVICLDQLNNPEGRGSAEERGSQHDGDVIVTKCGHLFHRECLGGWLLANKPNGCCPCCKAKISSRNFQRVFPPDSGENFELQLEQERELTRDLTARLDTCEQRIVELDEKIDEDDSKHSQIRNLYSLKCAEVLLLRDQMDFILNMHKTSECMKEKTLNATHNSLSTDTDPVVDISGEHEWLDAFGPKLLTPGTGFCIQVSDLKTLVKTFVNVKIAEELTNIDDDPSIYTFVDFDGMTKVMKFGRFYAGSFENRPASAATITINSNFFSSQVATPELIRQFFAQHACRQLNRRGGLNLDLFHLKIMVNLHVKPFKDEKENVAKTGSNNHGPPAKKSRMIKTEPVEGVKTKKERVVIDNITID